ncbi:hypothetical protein CKALI_00060 [Corynebacterium kalinowskii]|uniref:Uncharacterized protein n=1 Tax=Corynebacterium kalinowskii TaxID=2675216 RepID=A0A6B8VQ63_9CORY|nr:hypothetical protein CKALI_00060 [Corynebacterium kalinowskii]
MAGCGVDAEDVLSLADAICSHTGSSVRSLGALVALSALVKPHIAGIPVFASVADHCEYVRSACLALEPLNGSNEILGHALCSYIVDRS